MFKIQTDSRLFSYADGSPFQGSIACDGQNLAHELELRGTTLPRCSSETVALGGGISSVIFCPFGNNSYIFKTKPPTKLRGKD